MSLGHGLRAGWLALAAAVLLAACGAGQNAPQASAPSPVASPVPRGGDKQILLATTTSTQDSGLLDELIPRFEQQSGYAVKVIAVGSGAAIQLGQRGEVDVVLAHAPENERAFVESGAGVDRRLIMYNDFLLVGPAEDPAGIAGLQDALAAMGMIAASQSPFVSRGDQSGTQQLEQKLWKAANLSPQGQGWYVEAGAGMGQTLQIADQRSAYTISDRATYLAHKDRLALLPLVQGDARLLNVYHVIRVSKAMFPVVNEAGATALSAFLLASETQDLIDAFGRERFGEPLFTACAENSCKLADLD
ncbi:MAG TPA: substrate-binding domain-containing protein [Roseiflexaceae bacterium]|nr:substrate-binding domain-containing protein [Roseiflexaceae bacterium]